MAVSGPQWEVGIKRKRYSVELMLGKLREVEVLLAQGRTVQEVSREPGVTEQTCYGWRKERVGYLGISGISSDITWFS